MVYVPKQSLVTTGGEQNVVQRAKSRNNLQDYDSGRSPVQKVLC